MTRRKECLEAVKEVAASVGAAVTIHAPANVLPVTERDQVTKLAPKIARSAPSKVSKAPPDRPTMGEIRSSSTCLSSPADGACVMASAIVPHSGNQMLAIPCKGNGKDYSHFERVPIVAWMIKKSSSLLMVPLSCMGAHPTALVVVPSGTPCGRETSQYFILNKMQRSMDEDQALAYCNLREAREAAKTLELAAQDVAFKVSAGGIVTKDEVRTIARWLCNGPSGQNRVLKVLAKFDVQTVSDLDPANYEAVVHDLAVAGRLTNPNRTP
jgi:hypothetical protein